MLPAAEQAANSLRDALVRRGYAPGADGVLRVPLWELPNVEGVLLALSDPRSRMVELSPGEDHVIPEAAYRRLVEPPPVDPLAEYRDL
ncbi:hypothetical protein MCOL_V222613 [Mycobacterium colombiense CECT 3035]|uniref:Uncharacterized protein n=2 Tax=Mycobacterium colombiense TaxID=339268 RepID=J4SDG8_9MYCO|nr:hypothetical protein MCOL_V222613 [Mycobacterium colombiense CECT 3035]